LTIVDGVRTGALRSDLRPDMHGLLIFKMVVSLHEDLVAGALSSDDALEMGVAVAHPRHPDGGTLRGLIRCRLARCAAT
jgi:hypothetical protein